MMYFYSVKRVKVKQSIKYKVKQVFKTKIIGFAVTMSPKFEDKEFKSHFRLNRSSVQVRLIILNT